MTPHFLVLVAAVFYAIAALLIKRASDLGVGPLRTLLISNLVCVVVFLPLWGFGGTLHRDLWWQPLLIGICFMTGQGMTFLSLHKGDVSVATPVLGIKILIVAVLVTLLADESLTLQLWAAAALASLGVAILNRRSAKAQHHVGITIVMAVSAALAFALFDVLVQKWSPVWGLGRLLPLSIGAGGLLSLVLVFKLEEIPIESKRLAWRWLWPAAFVMSGQSLLFVYAIANWGQAAQANVIYSSRGLWSILLIWFVGHWFGSRETENGTAVLVWRLVGALMMLSAIILAML